MTRIGGFGTRMRLLDFAGFCWIFSGVHSMKAVSGAVGMDVCGCIDRCGSREEECVWSLWCVLRVVVRSVVRSVV